MCEWRATVRLGGSLGRRACPSRAEWVAAAAHLSKNPSPFTSDSFHIWLSTSFCSLDLRKTAWHCCETSGVQQDAARCNEVQRGETRCSEVQRGVAG